MTAVATGLLPKVFHGCRKDTKEGDEVEVLVLNVNPEARRMSLSIKGLSQPEPTKNQQEESAEAELPAGAKKPGRPANQPLKGGLGKSAGGESLGLKW